MNDTGCCTAPALDRVTTLLQSMLGIADIEPDTELVASDLLDSVNVVNLVLELEAEFGVQIFEAEIVPENFSNPNDIANLCDRLSTP